MITSVLSLPVHCLGGCRSALLRFPSGRTPDERRRNVLGPKGREDGGHAPANDTLEMDMETGVGSEAGGMTLDLSLNALEVCE